MLYSSVRTHTHMFAHMQVGQVLLSQARLARVGVPKVTEVIDFLEEDLGIKGKNLDKILAAWPRLLLLDTDTKLRPIADFLLTEVRNQHLPIPSYALCCCVFVGRDSQSLSF
jgi:hypothetical protein